MFDKILIFISKHFKKYIYGNLLKDIQSIFYFLQKRQLLYDNCIPLIFKYIVLYIHDTWIIFEKEISNKKELERKTI